MKSFMMGIAGVIVLAGAAQAQFTVAKIADEFGTIQSSGPRPQTNGGRFWNVQGSSNGTFASTATLRFYMDDVVAKFDAEYGAGQWFVSNVAMVLEHDDAGFSSSGNVDAYHFSNDALAITNGQASSDAPPGSFGSLPASPLRYQSGANFLNTRTNATNDVATIFGDVTQVDDFNFFPEGDGDYDVLGQANNIPTTLGAPNASPTYGLNVPEAAEGNPAVLDAERATAGSNLDITAIANDLSDGSTDALSFIFVEGDAGVSATYKGNPFGGRLPPRIYIEASLIPEPASLSLLAVGALALLRRR